MPAKVILSKDVEKYTNAAQSAMFQYQLIEQALKTYIFHAHQIVQVGLPAELDYSYKDSEYESMPLERLLNVFSKFTRNTVLLKQLNALRAPRNHVAHRSFALVFLSSVTEAFDFESEFKKVTEASESSAKALLAFKDELDAISSLSASLRKAKSVA